MTVSGPHKLNGGWASDANSWAPTGDGVFMTYQAVQPYNDGARIFDALVLTANISAGGPIQGLFYWQDPAQATTINTDINIIIANQKCYSEVVHTQVVTDVTNGKTIPAQGFGTFDSLNGKALIAITDTSSTGYGPFKISTYNGVLNTLGGSPPAGGYVKVVNNFAFLSGNLTGASTISRVYWSNVGDPETWTSSNFIDVNLNDGDQVVALSSIGNNLIIFKRNSTWSLSTTTTTTSGVATLGPLTCISPKYGCIGPLCVDSMPDGTIVFMSVDGHLRQTDGSIIKDISSVPFPASNMSDVFSALNFSLHPHLTVASTNVALKVDQAFSRIIFIFNSSNKSYSYDYVRMAWADITSTITGLFVAQTMPAVGGGIFPVLYVGLNEGHIGYLSPESTQIRSIANVSYSPSIVKSFILDAMGPPGFVPRSIVVPLYFPNSSNTYGTISVSIGFDGAAVQSIASYSLSGTTSNYYRIVAPIVIRNGIAGKQPISMQVQISAVGTGANNGIDPFAIEPFYFSDEGLT